MELVVSPDGIVRCIYGDDLDLHTLGFPQIRRASAVEPDDAGRWCADLSPAGGPRLGSFDRRSDAVAAEVAWLTECWLAPTFPLSNPRSVHEGVACTDRDSDPAGSDRLPRPPLRDQPPVVTFTPERNS